ncbi:MAG: Translation elongation factor Ts [uncultured Campylobacterales bacterium]|uniref:Elongation factor Ts n=1 Tax=uncultured Campylobacterales bacterium TaxID=352960 RepID=A0A6S6T8H3_9BACT|nr:MAG: Translation elongation factor Ts [uncultured Campylobacterales bacterium]
MAVAPSLIKELREKSGAGMLDCKKALNQCDGDIEKAMLFLRESGLAKAAKKSGNVAAEGIISLKINDDFTKATMLEMNSQTDFVAQNENFLDFVKETVDHVQANDLADSEVLRASTFSGTTYEEYLNNKIATIGENLVPRKIANVSSTVVNGYVHSNGRIGVLLAATCDESAKEKTLLLLKSIGMHAAAMKPSVISYKDLDPEFIESENKAIIADIEKENIELHRLGKPLKKIPEYVSRSQLGDEVIASAKTAMEEELKAQGKPETIWERIIPGQIARFIQDNTQLDSTHSLLSQTYVIDDKKTVEQAIKDTDPSIEIVKYVRFELGDGIEKKEEDFAAEVASQLG